MLTPDELAFLDGLLQDFDDLPDGAWQAACEDMIGMQPQFKGRDANAVFLEWSIADDEGLDEE